MTTAAVSYNVAPNPNDNIGERLPIGSILLWTTSSAPAGFLSCDGSAVSRNTFAALFGVMGTTFGPGDGITTFNLPNFTQSRFPLGFENGTNQIGDTGGSTTTMLQTENLPLHGHNVFDPGHQHNYVKYGQNGSTGLINGEFEPQKNSFVSQTAFAQTGIEIEFSVTNQQGGTITQVPVDVQNAFLVVNYVVKAQ